MANTTIPSVTKVAKFNALAKVLTDNGLAKAIIDGVEVDYTEFIAHEVELLEKKASKATKKVDNSANIELVKGVLADRQPHTPTEIQALTGLANTQKVASVLKAMGDAVKKDVKGKKVTYTLA